MDFLTSDTFDNPFSFPDYKYLSNDELNQAKIIQQPKFINFSTKHLFRHLFFVIGNVSILWSVRLG
jgi:hypothetical protein